MTTPIGITVMAKTDNPQGDSKISIIDAIIEKLTAKSSKDLIVGTVTGWIAGVTVVKVGKIAAFGLGGGIILLHFASEGGYVAVNWERVREAAARGPAGLDAALRLARGRSCYCVGFTGGFFFGVAST